MPRPGDRGPPSNAQAALKAKAALRKTKKVLSKGKARWRERHPGFYDLPVELQNQILEYCLVTDTGKLSPGGTLDYGPNKPTVALLRVSRHFHQLAAPIFYGQNTFVATHGRPWEEEAWFNQATKPRIRRAEIQFGGNLSGVSTGAHPLLFKERFDPPICVCELPPCSERRGERAKMEAIKSLSLRHLRIDMRGAPFPHETPRDAIMPAESIQFDAERDSGVPYEVEITGLSDEEQAAEVQRTIVEGNPNVDWANIMVIISTGPDPGRDHDIPRGTWDWPTTPLYVEIPPAYDEVDFKLPKKITTIHWTNMKNPFHSRCWETRDVLAQSTT